MIIKRYITVLQQILAPILSIGIQEELEFLQQKKIKMTNLMALAFISTILVNYICALILKRPELPVFMLLLNIPPIICLYLNHKQRYVHSRILLVIAANLTIIIIPSYFKLKQPQDAYAIHYITTYIYAGIASILPILVFSLKQKKQLIIGLLFSLACLLIIEPIDTLLGVSITNYGYSREDYFALIVAICICATLLIIGFLSLERILVDNEVRHLKLLKELNYSYKELQKIEKEVRRNVSMLEQEILYRQETEKELYQAKEKAEKASLNKALFLSTMTHELRTPMNAVIGTVHLLLENNPKPDQIEDLQILKFSAENLLSLINDILDFNKIEAGKVEFEQTEFELSKLIKSILQSMAYKAQQSQIELRIRKDEHIPPIITGDPVRLSQVLNNLVSNAVKFTEKGYVEIALERIKQESDNIWIKFSVTDTGIGIPKNKTKLIFESYSQASRDTTRKFGGTGLGLAITKKLLELQDSQINLESAPGKGSKFYFTLRFKISQRPSHYMPMAEEDMNDKDTLNGIKVLVAEDNHLNQVIIRKFFAKWGIQADIVENGKLAVHQLEEKRYDVVLMDLEMPIMNGYEASRIINSRFPDIPILAFSAYNKEESLQRIKGTGMIDCITKPLRPKDLFEMLVRYSKKKLEARGQ
jgi:signal transduction histidine kinase/ActR/RegA family two-component response regulator